jgi:hypothetical protein
MKAAPDAFLLRLSAMALRIVGCTSAAAAGAADEWTSERAEKLWSPMVRPVQHVGIPGYQFQTGVMWDGSLIFGPPPNVPRTDLHPEVKRELVPLRAPAADQTQGNGIAADGGLAGIGRLPECLLGRLLEAYVRPPPFHGFEGHQESVDMHRGSCSWR